MGIVSLIIALKKGHTGYAIFLGVWMTTATILCLTQTTTAAFFPGAIFLIIAIRMEDLKKSKTIIQPNVFYRCKDCGYITVRPAGSEVLCSCKVGHLMSETNLIAKSSKELDQFLNNQSYKLKESTKAEEKTLIPESVTDGKSHEPVKPLETDNPALVTCPLCNTLQQKGRALCFRCGVKFFS